MKTVIITGANGNLGTATVKKFLDEGYSVIAVDAKNDHLEFASGNKNFEFRSVDLTNESVTQDFVNDVIAKHGKVDAALLLVGGFAMGMFQQQRGQIYKNNSHSILKLLFLLPVP